MMTTWKRAGEEGEEESRGVDDDRVEESKPARLPMYVLIGRRLDGEVAVSSW